jgi:hypothetical protein
VTGSVHPRSGPSIAPNTTQDSAAVSSSPPGKSTEGRRSSREFGIFRSAPAATPPARTTFNQNTDCQPNRSSSRPELTRPRTAPAPATPIQAPTAFARCCTGNDDVMIDRVVGITMAAPTPISARAPISGPGVVHRAAAAEADPKISSPRTSSGLRPNRSPSAPAGSNRPANTRA